MSLQITIVNEKLDKKEVAFDFLADFDVKTSLIAEVVRSEQMNLRQGNAHTKVRGEVRGGGKKPWKQKGTGRARHGSIRSPLWVGGGVTFGPRNLRNWTCKINKSARIAAIKSILKDRLVNDSVFKFESEAEFPKTKDAVSVLNIIAQNTGEKLKKHLIIYTPQDKSLLMGFPNTEAQMINVEHLKVHTLSNCHKLIFTDNAKACLEERLSPSVK